MKPTQNRPAKKSKQTLSHYDFPLGRTNFIIIAASIVAIIIGFALMAGGGSDESTFNPEIFNSTRIVVGPTIAFLGFIGVGVGIMWKKKEK